MAFENSRKCFFKTQKIILKNMRFIIENIIQLLIKIMLGCNNIGFMIPK